MSAKEKTTGFIAEFRQFIARGNVMDMAVGVIVGGAFKSIADSLVADIINPILGVFTGSGTDLSGLAIALPGGGDIMAGNFINAVVNFLIMAFVVFCIIKALNIFHREKEEAPPAPLEPSAEEKLLTEIRDLLKERKDA
ncbi:large conductance mechanosensitive channel protein MscL [Pseudoflavonifractor sp. MSJ-37]|uniref:large conductance mechanosensitive channel protein MscL n=1 Tax=Pseudoflavonifractor sp. MSJ-37 TaxID=2841531 RepID=UPI001C119AB7|nr:large conductance mechanosensitive channel protein MscL [Pseudoflavonifractor sp. MSJ-37]MBU5435410.1 large conductance mechanosensitive channel protein MscL [Pseudoflavonifractor sp. MSJ-37]